MKLAIAALVLLLNQFQNGDDAVSKNNIPLSPIERKQIIIAGGLDFKLVPDEGKTFDPNKEMPSIVTSTEKKTILSWQPTPSNLIVTDTEVLPVIENTKDGPLYHWIEVIKYQDKKPWGLLFNQVTVLLFDHHIFCVCFGYLGDDEGPGVSSDAELAANSQGVLQLNVEQHLQTRYGAISSVNFKFSSKGPLLIEIKK